MRARLDGFHIRSSRGKNGQPAVCFLQSYETDLVGSDDHSYVFRFFISFFESAFQPGTILLMGSWYTRTELAKRLSFWFIAGTAGQAFSGFLQAAIYRNLDGVAGLAGWRWLYIICGIMTLPCGLALLFFLPDYPSNTKGEWCPPGMLLPTDPDQCGI